MRKFIKRLLLCALPFAFCGQMAFAQNGGVPWTIIDTDNGDVVSARVTFSQIISPRSTSADVAFVTASVPIRIPFGSETISLTVREGLATYAAATNLTDAATGYLPAYTGAIPHGYKFRYALFPRKSDILAISDGDAGMAATGTPPSVYSLMITASATAEQQSYDELYLLAGSLGGSDTVVGRVVSATSIWVSDQNWLQNYGNYNIPVKSNEWFVLQYHGGVSSPATATVQNLSSLSGTEAGRASGLTSEASGWHNTAIVQFRRKSAAGPYR